MYIIKNALRCISRSVGRNILIGIIVLAIAGSACIGLSIRQAAESAKSEALATLSVTGTISFDRSSAIKNLGGESGNKGSFDRNQFAQMMGAASSLTLEEYQTYAAADSVKDFYYTVSAALNGSDAFKPVTSDAEDTASETSASEQPPVQSGFGDRGNKGGMSHMMGAQSDFSIVGVSGESAMTAFMEGTASVTSGAVFAEGTEAYECLISDELAAFNNIAVGDTVVLTNPNSETESYTFTVVGTYTDASSNESSFSMMGATSTDPANRIYMSAAALGKLTAASAEVSTTQTDENTGREFNTAVSGSVSATYVFADTDAYYRFEDEVRAMGLADTYTVTSPDIAAFENSLVPLNTLSRMAGYFLTVILLIGAIILIVLNIFNVRERKYEIGVLTAMGMKKGKVATQFLVEIFTVTLAAVIIGMGIGAVSAVPVTNALLENQVASQTASQDRMEQSFGRPGMDGGQTDAPAGGRGFDGMMGSFFGNTENSYVTEISSAMNFTVVLQMLGIAVLLTLAGGAASMLFVMRYEPLKILANRD